MHNILYSTHSRLVSAVRTLALFAPTLAAAATSAPTQSATPPPRATPTPSPTASPLEASVDADVTASPAPDQVNPKPQEGIEPDEIDYVGDDEPQPLTPDFSILLGGGTEGGPKDDGVVVLGAEVQAEVSEILKTGMAEADRPVEDVAFQYGKIIVKLEQELSLFGVIHVTPVVTVEVNADGRVKVRYPWWAFLASGKDDTLGEKIFSTLSNVLKTKHDTVKNSISNVR